MTTIPFLSYETVEKLLLVFIIACVPVVISSGWNLLRSLQWAWRLPGPSLWEIVLVHSRPLMSSEAIAQLFNLSSAYDFKPWLLWTPIHHFTVISDPETVGEVYKSKHLLNKEQKFYEGVEEYLGASSLTLNGAEWKIRRTMLNPAFNKAFLENNFDVIREESDRMIQTLNGKADGTDFDVLYYISRTLVRSSIRSLADRDMDITEKLVGDVTWALDFGTSMLHKKFINPVQYHFEVNFMKKTRSLLKKFFLCREDCKDLLRAALKRILLTMSEGVSQETPIGVIALANAKNNILTDEEIVCETFTLLAAAIETTSQVLSAAICMLALHPEIQNKARNELEAIFGASNCPTSTEDLPRMEYLEKVIKETLRLFPPGSLIVRRADEDTDLNGAFVPEGSTVIANIFALHRNPNVFEEPLKFNPDRFSSGAQEARHPYAYVPFSAGPRNCAGRLHAMVVMKSMLSSLLRNYKVLPGAGMTSVQDVKVEVSFTLKVSGTHVRLVPVNVVH